MSFSLSFPLPLSQFLSLSLVPCATYLLFTIELVHFKRNFTSAGSDELANSNNSSDFKKIIAMMVYCYQLEHKSNSQAIIQRAKNGNYNIYRGTKDGLWRTATQLLTFNAPLSQNNLIERREAVCVCVYGNFTMVYRIDFTLLLYFKRKYFYC